MLIRVENTRHSARNREITRKRLAELVRKALAVPKRRGLTKPTLESMRQRLEEKARRGKLRPGDHV